MRGKDDLFAAVLSEFGQETLPVKLFEHNRGIADAVIVIRDGRNPLADLKLCDRLIDLFQLLLEGVYRVSHALLTILGRCCVSLERTVRGVD